MTRGPRLIAAIIALLVTAVAAPLGAEPASFAVIVRLKHRKGAAAYEAVARTLLHGSNRQARSHLRASLAARKQAFYGRYKSLMDLVFEGSITNGPPVFGGGGGTLAQEPSVFKARKITEFRPLWLIDAVRLRCGSSFLQKLRHHPDVAEVVFDPFLSVSVAQKPDPAQGEGWHLADTGLDRAQAMGFTGKGVTVGVIDTGLSPKAPFKDRVVAYKDFTSEPRKDLADPLGHGTSVASVIVGGGPEAPGAAPGAKLVVARVIEELTIGPDRESRRKVIGAFASRVIEAMQWMLDPDGDPKTGDAPDVINNSWGMPPSEDLAMDVFLPAFTRLRAAGIIPVVSAGNSFGPGLDKVNVPGIYREVITVGASDRHRRRAAFSCRGDAASPVIKPDFVAPGEAISAFFDDGLTPAGVLAHRGTSFAAPVVTGLIALMLEADPELDFDGCVQALSAAAVDLGKAGKDRETGYGLIQAVATLKALRQRANFRAKTRPDIYGPVVERLEAALGAP